MLEVDELLGVMTVVVVVVVVVVVAAAVIAAEDDEGGCGGGGGGSGGGGGGGGCKWTVGFSGNPAELCIDSTGDSTPVDGVSGGCGGLETAGGTAASTTPPFRSLPSPKG